MVKKGQTFIWTFNNHTSQSPLILHALTKTWYRSIKESLFSLNINTFLLLTVSYPYIPFVFFMKCTLSTIWTSTGNMQAFHWLSSLQKWKWSSGSQWNACICTHLPVMLPVDVQIVERVDFVKKRREYRGKLQGGVDMRIDFPWSIGTKFLSVHVKLAEISMCDCQKSEMKVCPFFTIQLIMDWLGKSMEKWRDLGKNLGKPPCKVVPVIR